MFLETLARLSVDKWHHWGRVQLVYHMTRVNQWQARSSIASNVDFQTRL